MNRREWKRRQYRKKSLIRRIAGVVFPILAILLCLGAGLFFLIKSEIFSLPQLSFHREKPAEEEPKLVPATFIIGESPLMSLEEIEARQAAREAEFNLSRWKTSHPPVRGIYITGPTAGSSRMEEILQLLDDTELNALVIDVNGVGYLLSVSMNTLQDTPPVGESMKAYTLLSVREDAMELFGFSTQEEKRMFSRLLGVSGIGPKVALSILGSMPLRDLTLAIVTSDTTSLSRAPGVGKKTAQRIALELKEKVDESDLNFVPSAPAGGFTPVQEDAAQEALAALQSLGYTAAEAAKAVSQVRGQSDSANEIVRLALRNMAGF